MPSILRGPTETRDEAFEGFVTDIRFAVTLLVGRR
jgi:hypothetical protein